MKNVVVVNTNDVCKMRKKTNYVILDENLIHKYIRKYINSFESNKDKSINMFRCAAVELNYDNKLLKSLDVIYDDDLIGYEIVTDNDNKLIMFNYDISDIILQFVLIVSESQHYISNICIHQLYGGITCKLSNYCTKYNNLLKNK